MLAPIEDKKMYLHILGELKDVYENGFNREGMEIIVVSQYEEILQHAAQCGMFAVYNNLAMEGISASVRLGVSRANNPEWYFFFNADQPYLTASTIKRFINSTLESNKSMASVQADNIPGSPTAFKSNWKNKLLELEGDVGGRSIMRQHPENIFWFEIDKKEITDIDFQ